MAQNHSGTRIHGAQSEETNPRSGWQTVGRGGAARAAEPLLIQKKETEPAERVAENVAIYQQPGIPIHQR